MRHDPISLIATFGAPLLVGLLLLYRIISGHWGAVAFMAITFAVVMVLYLRFVPIDQLDDEVPATNTENAAANDGEPSSADRSTTPDRMAAQDRQLT